MENSYNASLGRRKLLKHAGAAGLGIAVGSFMVPATGAAQSGPPLTGRFGAGGSYMLAQPGFRLPDQVDLGGGFIQRLEFYDRRDRPFVLSDYRGKVTLVQFWHSNCQGCQAEVPALDKLAGVLEGAKFEILPIALSTDSQTDIDRFYRQKGIRNLEVMRDRTSFVFNNLAPKHPRLNAQATPTTLLIDANGDALGAYVGVAGWEQPAGRALLDYYISRV